MAKNSEAATAEYHYVQQEENRETVRLQGRAINKALKKLRRISSREFTVPEIIRDDEPTQPHVTLPNGKAVDLLLKEALEDAEQQCRKSEMPSPAEEKKRKRWFGWAD